MCQNGMVWEDNESPVGQPMVNGWQCSEYFREDMELFLQPLFGILITFDFGRARKSAPDAMCRSFDEVEP